MKYVIIVLSIMSLGSILTGYLISNELSDKFIGFGVIGLFIFVFPLFIFYRWKDKSMKDYMITKETIDKMRNHQKKN